MTVSMLLSHAKNFIDIECAAFRYDPLKPQWILSPKGHYVNEDALTLVMLLYG